MDIAGKPLAMIIDTGATKTIINEQTHNELIEVLPSLNSSSAVLTTYTGQTVAVLGELQEAKGPLDSFSGRKQSS